MGGPRGARLLLIALIAGGLALAGCTKAHPSGKTAPSAGATLAEGQVPGVTATDVASQIQAMIDRAESAANTPFKAQYSITINGKPEALTLEEKGTNQRVSSEGLGEFISTPAVDAFCVPSPKQACFAEGSSSNPLAALVAFAEPKAVLDVIQGDEADMAGDTHVYTVTMSTQTHSGARDTCAQGPGNGDGLLLQCRRRRGLREHAERQPHPDELHDQRAGRGLRAAGVTGARQPVGP